MNNTSDGKNKINKGLLYSYSLFSISLLFYIISSDIDSDRAFLLGLPTFILLTVTFISSIYFTIKYITLRFNINRKKLFIALGVTVIATLILSSVYLLYLEPRNIKKDCANRTIQIIKPGSGYKRGDYQTIYQACLNLEGL